MLGPVINKSQFWIYNELHKIGKEEGAEILTVGNRTGEKGFYIEPTVFVNVNNKMRIAQEEIFGPVLVG